MTATKNKESEGRKSTNGKSGPTGYENPYENWTQLYQQMATEGMTFFQKGVEAAQDMMPNPEQHQGMYQHWNDSFVQFMQQAGTEGQAQDPETYKKLYHVWLDTWSQNFESYMRSPEFVKSSGKNLEAFSDAKSQMGEMLEEYWKNIHLPSSRDMREVYHKLYIMERKQDEQDRKLDKLNETMAQILKAVQNTTPPATAPVVRPKSAPKPSPKATKKAK